MVPGRIGWQAAGCLAGGIALLLVELLIFLVSLMAPARGHDYMPGIIGGASVGAIALIARGVYLLRTTVRVTLDSVGIHLEGLISRQLIRWDQIERIEQQKRAQWFGNTIKVLTLRGARGKALARVSDSVLGFDLLATEIAARSAQAGGQSIYDPASDRTKDTARESRRLRWVGALMLLLAAAAATAFGFGLNEDLHTSRYDTEGVRTDARITQRYMVSVTPRLEYSFKDEQGRPHTREAVMEKNEWERLAPYRKVRVEYLRSDPEWSRVLHGEQHDSMGGKFLFVSGAGTIMFGTFALLTLLGLDLKIENGQTLLTRRGKVIRAWGASVPPGPPAPPWPAAHSGAAPYPVAGVAPHPYTAQPYAAYPVPPTWSPPPPYTGKPRGLVALGILSIIFGTLQLLIDAVRLIVLQLPAIQLGDRSLDMSQAAWGTTWAAGDLLLAILLIATGIGLTVIRPWGRLLGILVAGLQVLSSIGAIAMTVTSVVRLHREVIGPDSGSVMAGAFAAIVTQLLGIVFPLVLLILLLRRRTAESIARAAATSASPPAGRT